MPLNLENMKLFLGPLSAGAPDDLKSPIVQAILEAKKSVYLSTQQLESRPIVDALIQARKRGVTIKVILERDYLMERRVLDVPWLEGGWNENNRQALNALLRSKISLRIDRSYRTLHNNFILVDHRSKDAAKVLTTSANLTPRGLDLHYNHLFIINNQRLALDFYQEFDRIWDNDYRFRHGDAPMEVLVGTVRVKPIFAPNHAPEMELMKQIAKGKSQIDFAMYSFSTSSGIDDALKLAARAGINIQGIMDRNQANQRWAATHGLTEAGVKVFLSKDELNNRKLHHKLLVVDDRVAILGTFNFSKSANFNEEVIIVVGDLEETRETAIENQKKIVKYIRTEIERIIADTLP